MRQSLNTVATSTRHSRWWWCFGAVALLLGIYLRFAQLGQQILIIDEWHALHALFAHDAAWIATHFGGADYSIPLTLYYRLLYDLGWLTEWTMRAPIVLAGSTLLVLAPWLLRSCLSLPVRMLWLAMMAVSPLSIYLSRTARPYALSSLLTLIAVIACWHWWTRSTRQGRWAAMYLLCTALAGWLHLLTLPFTLAPLLCFGMLSVWRLLRVETRGIAWCDLRRLLFLGVLVGLLLAALLLPPLLNDWRALTGKAGLGALSWSDAWHTLLMLAGSGRSWVGVGIMILAAIGIRHLWRQLHDWLACALSASVLGVAAILISQPAWVQHPPVLARYLLPVLPLGLLLSAAGLARLLDGLRHPWIRVASAALVIAWLVAAGPLPRTYYRPNQFMGHMRFQFAYDSSRMLQATSMRIGEIPQFYFDLAQLPPRSVTLVEAPWRLESWFLPYPWYQQLHRQDMRIGLVTPVCGVRTWGEYPEADHGIHLTQFMHLSAILRGELGDADYLVLHMSPWVGQQFPQMVRWPDMDACLASVSAQLGPPMVRDRQIAVFDLHDVP